MTITTAKRLPRLAPLAAAMLLALPAQAGWRVVPTLTTSVTYTDNINLQADERKRSELVAQLAPGVTVIGTSPRLNVSASAEWHQFAFLHDVGNRTTDNQRQYSGALRGILSEDLLYIDASTSRGQRSTSAFGPQLSTDLYSLGNRTEIETWSVSPYLVHRFGNTASAQLRYTRDAVDSAGGSVLGDAVRNGFYKSDSDAVSASLASGSNFDTVGWGLNYYRQDLDSARYGESTTESLRGNLSYRISPRLALTATAGYDRYDFGGLGSDNKDEGRNWSAGFAWKPGARTSLEASLGRHYYGQTGSLLASHRSRQTVWSVSYSDAVTTSRQQFLLPTAIDTAALLDRLFSASFPDPVERQRVVAAYMQATGLPPSLADSVNFLSNRYMRQKSLQATSAYRLGRSSAVLSLYANERIALTDAQSDSDLLGSQLSNLNTNVRQRGLDATFTRQLNSRSSVIGGWNVQRSQSLTTGLVNHQRTLRVGLTRRYGERMLGTVEMRRRSGDVGVGNSGTYSENAISASLSMKL
ncbi:TIGR03016 family PEP-CTERM system-associated outer membrane protein [Massilia sp. ZL223]|uniref:TIGR03016 family PEP-CTERM system-associated outer membrane protein n=1 Tax=Massilia sp. ZL223 TaxID=2824904 RepID=UPI001B82D35D|nr:TIGR03016 family PEP-CTERM system-associated outer membrane protein [Massilia sp. ZL223]MBQ5964539.1 TIGR03016 family PEP-CTERM system-associated outer membrane protein [Massilia sp. ZL223]